MDDIASKTTYESRPDAPPEVAGSSISTRIRYTLRYAGPPSISQLVAVAVATAVYTVMSWLTITALPSLVPGVSAFFIPLGFGLAFSLWFGGWAFVIAYIGNFVGAGLLVNTPLPQAMVLGCADLIQLCVPMLIYRLLAPRFGLSSIGKDVWTVRGFIFFLLVAVIPNNILGGLYANLMQLVLGITKTVPLFLTGWLTWSSTNMVVAIVIGATLLATMGPIVERFGLTVRNLLN